MADVRIQHSALESLQHASEAYLADIFRRAQLCAIHAKRITLQKKDMELVRVLGENENPKAKVIPPVPRVRRHEQPPISDRDVKKAKTVKKQKSPDPAVSSGADAEPMIVPEDVPAVSSTSSIMEEAQQEQPQQQEPTHENENEPIETESKASKAVDAVEEVATFEVVEEKMIMPLQVEEAEERPTSNVTSNMILTGADPASEVVPTSSNIITDVDVPEVPQVPEVKDVPEVKQNVQEEPIVITPNINPPVSPAPVQNAGKAKKKPRMMFRKNAVTPAKDGQMITRKRMPKETQKTN